MSCCFLFFFLFIISWSSKSLDLAHQLECVKQDTVVLNAPSEPSIVVPVPPDGREGRDMDRVPALQPLPGNAQESQTEISRGESVLLSRRSVGQDNQWWHRWHQVHHDCKKNPTDLQSTRTPCSTKGPGDLFPSPSSWQLSSSLQRSFSGTETSGWWPSGATTWR